MAVKQFTIGTSKTINLGNFESHRVEAAVIWEVDGPLDYSEQVNAAQAELRALLEQTYKAQRNTAKDRS